MLLDRDVDTLKKIGIQVQDDLVLLQSQEHSEEMCFPMSSLDSIQLIRTKASIFQKVLYWGQRLWTFDNFTGTGYFDDETKFWGKYELVFTFKDMTKHVNRIQDFDKIGVLNSLKRLNSMINHCDK